MHGGTYQVWIKLRYDFECFRLEPTRNRVTSSDASTKNAGFTSLQEWFYTFSRFSFIPTKFSFQLWWFTRPVAVIPSNISDFGRNISLTRFSAVQKTINSPENKHIPWKSMFGRYKFNFEHFPLLGYTCSCLGKNIKFFVAFFAWNLPRKQTKRPREALQIHGWSHLSGCGSTSETSRWCGRMENGPGLKIYESYWEWGYSSQLCLFTRG